ncbi:triose-phosphate isomerase [Roseinatronobacter sp.]|uniref:triose-phosphate isomerase n=1 Tax=Roseinatronobacter sp. TaxID=1945755 RepID=UPI0025CFC90E|nr:triose-phosphate isomerase [Roseibaca sp.]
MPCKLAAGNWKMNGLRADLDEMRALIAAHPDPDCRMLICPPATLLAPMADLAQGSRLLVGGQDCHTAKRGAHTGDLSADMLADAGARHVILGHSERRADHRESSDLVSAKARAAREAGLTAIICVGETEAQRDAGTTLEVVLGQLRESVPDGANAGNTVIAYEPVWAIGTGRTPTLEQIAEVHDALRAAVPDAEMSLLYGGSVKPGNAADIFALANVDGALVGGASLKASDFGAIIAALDAA